MKHLNLIPQSKIRIKKLFIKYKSLKLIPKIGVTILAAAIIGGLVGGIVIYNIKSKPVSFDQDKPTTQTVSKPHTTQQLVQQPPLTATGIIDQLNQERVSKGLSSLNPNTELDNAAVARG